jgi:hypothetical protein
MRKALYPCDVHLPIRKERFSMSEMQGQEGRATNYTFSDQDQQKKLRGALKNENATIARPAFKRGP